MKKIKYKNHEITEDATKYEEFVCSYYKWLPIKKQKEKAQELENITKEK